MKLKPYELELLRCVVDTIDDLVIYLENQDSSKAKQIDRLGVKIVSAMWGEK